MRRLVMLTVLVCMAAGCDDDEQTQPSDASTVTPSDAAAGDAAAIDATAPVPDAAVPADTGVPAVRSLLPRPGLERPPAGKLPDDLKPPVR